MSRRDAGQAYGQLLKELNEERLAALTRISRTLESLIDQLQDLRSHATMPGSDAYERQMTRYRELRERAKQYRWYLEVQREALGIRHHGILDEMYKIPGPL